jgi:hypothetical protein
MVIATVGLIIFVSRPMLRCGQALRAVLAPHARLNATSGPGMIDA